jgi:hypothetical protein
MDWQGNRTSSWIAWNYPTLAYTGNTVGWPRGDITIYGTLYAPNGETTYENHCANSTYCSIASIQVCPSVPGTYTFYVIAYGLGGSDDASQSVVVTL